jgi:hypothetical protein
MEIAARAQRLLCRASTGFLSSATMACCRTSLQYGMSNDLGHAYQYEAS